MELKIVKPDTFKILTSTKKIVENLKFITINEAQLDETTNKLLFKLDNGVYAAEMGVGITGNYENDVQLVFLEDVVNFCFWVEKDKPPWHVEYLHRNFLTGGWFSLLSCFQRALANNIPILDANFLSSLTLTKVKEIFKGESNIDIPLVEKRLENLKEAGQVLQSKYSGKFINALESTNYDALDLVKLVYDNFKSFQDKTILDGKEIYFLKRAQMFTQDLSYLTQNYKDKPIKNLQILTASADYKLPQMLRKYGAINYSEELSKQVDNYILIPAGSREEIEIRAVTIWCVELIRQKLEKFTAAEIDNALWLISQDQTNVKPFHRTYTIFY